MEEKENNKEKTKQKSKRNISILTVFLWLILIAVMSVITISGIVKNNAVEVEYRYFTVKIDISEVLQDEDFDEEKIGKCLNSLAADITFYREKGVYEGIGARLKTRCTELKVDGNIATLVLSIYPNTYLDWSSVVNKEIYMYISNNTSNSGYMFNQFNNYWLMKDYKFLDVNMGNNYVEKIEATQEMCEYKLSKKKPVRIHIDTSNLKDENAKKRAGVYQDNYAGYTKLISRDENSSVFEIYPIKKAFFSISSYNNLVVYEGDKELKGEGGYFKDINQSDTTTDYYFTVKEAKPKLTQSIEWKEDGNAALKVKTKDFVCFGLNSGLIFAEKLDDNFRVSEKYENDEKWLITNESDIEDIELVKMDSFENSKYMTNKVYSKFYKYYENYEWYQKYHEDLNIRYVYLKDKNILYRMWLSYEGPIDESIELEYVGDDTKGDKIYNFDNEIISFYNDSSCGTVEAYHYITTELLDKKIKSQSIEKANIVVNKFIEDEEDKIYYVGLFEDSVSDRTDNVYEIKVENGEGKTNIEIENYDDKNNYYIYEVDERGNKIASDNVYNKNRVLEEYNTRKEYEIKSNKEIVSAVEKNTNYENESIGSGEEKYINNENVITTVKEDTVIISPKVKKYVVKYESEKGGSLIGEVEEILESGNTPVNVPKISVDENYEFEKWIVVKNGEEIEVIPSEYVVLEDTTFIAKYKKIEKIIEKEEENIPALPDTSDINIWKYVSIFVISILIICIIFLILKLSKSNKK